MKTFTPSRPLQLFLVGAFTVLAVACTATPDEMIMRRYARSEAPAPTPVNREVRLKQLLLAADFLKFLNDLYPSYNDIQVAPEVTTADGGSAIWVQHPFLGPMAFAAGPEKGSIQRWVDSHRAQLRAANIRFVRIGDDITNNLRQTLFV